MDCSCQVPPPMGFSRQEYWSGCHFLLQGIFPTQGSNRNLLCLVHWQAGSLPVAPPGLKPFQSYTAVQFSSVQFSSVAQSCLTLCDTMNRSTPSLPVYHQLPEFTQTHVHRVSDAIQPSHFLSSPFPPAASPSQRQSFFQLVNTLLKVAKVASALASVLPKKSQG